MVFPVVRYECKSWTVKKVECRRTDAFELWCWKRLLRVPWTAKKSKQSILKEINPEYSLEGLMLKLKLRYFGHLMRRANSLEKTLMLGKTEGRRRGHDRGWGGWVASPTPRAYSNSCPSSRWCHPTISSAVIPFSSCLQSFPASGSFQMSQLFTSGGQSIGVSAWASVPSNEYSRLISFRMHWLDLLIVWGYLKSFLQHHSSKASILWCSAFFLYSPTLTSIHEYWKNHSFD